MNAATGNKFQTENDFTTDPHSGLGLTRYYNSQDTTSSPFGKSWHSTWHRGLVINGNVVTVTRADGREDTFTNNGAGVYTADADVTSTFAQITDTNGALTGWQLTLADDTVETYLVGGQLASIASRAGLVTMLSYDNSGSNVTRVTGPFGHVMSFAYDANNYVTSLTAPDGGVYAYTYDANNNLTSVTFPDGKVKQYLYENTTFPNALTGIVDESNVRFATYAYDTQGRAVSTQHAGGAELTTIAYNSDGSSTVTDANGNVHSYGFTTQFGVFKPVSLAGAPVPYVGGSAFTYDANGFIASKTDYDGNITTFTHDARGNETSRTEAAGSSLARSFATTWHPTFHLPVQITEPLATGITPGGSSRTTTFTYDAHGNLLSRTVTASLQSRTWSFTYNAQGLVLTSTDPRGDVTRHSYDTRGDVATVTDALGHVTRFTAYDGAGRLLSVTDPNGLVTTFTYDARGRGTARTIGTEKTTLTYDAAGNVTGVTLPDGSFRTYAYDAAHRLTGLRDALGNGIGFSLDGNDNRVQVGAYDSANNLVQHRSFAYDSVNRLVQEIGSQGQTTAYNYDPQGNLTGVSDPLNHATSYNYDALNRPVQATDASGGLTRFGYDALDRLTAEQDPRNLTTGYFYDGLDDQTGVTSSDTGNTVKTYDAAGSVLTATDARGMKTTYTYDALNRLTRALYADGTSSTYQYDQGTNGIGHLTRMTDPAGTTTWVYDVHGRVTRKTQQSGGLTLLTRMGYDAGGRLASIIYPSGKTVNVGYDADGQVNGLSQGNRPLVSNVIYRPYGPAQSWLEGNGTSFIRSFDMDGRLTGISMGGTTPATIAYVYDAANRITGETETGQPGQAFGYDALDRLMGFVNGTAQTAYTYDADGNRLNLSTTPATNPATTPQTYAYDTASNRLISEVMPGPIVRRQPTTTTLSFTYDATGNNLSDSNHVFTYDARGRMAAVAESATPQGTRQATHYAVNGLGERIAKRGTQVQPNGEVNYVYDGAGHLLGEYDGDGTTIEETVYLGDLPVAVMDERNNGTIGNGAGSIHYVNPDNLGAPHAIADLQGRTVWSWHHAPFGDTAPVSTGPNGGPNGNFTYNLRFPGQIADDETGLSNNLFRDYNPATGRYVQSDPLGLFAGVNTYGYVDGNPVNNADPFGLWLGWDDVIASGTGAIVGVAGQGLSDILHRQFSDWEHYTGAAIGGAASGETLLYTLNPFLAGAAGGITTNAVTQGLEIAAGNKHCFSSLSLLEDAVIGTASGSVPGLGKLLPGAGGGSWNAVTRQIITKFGRGQIESISSTTTGRVFANQIAEGLPGAGAAAAALNPRETPSCVCSN